MLIIEKGISIFEEKVMSEMKDDLFKPRFVEHGSDTPSNDESSSDEEKAEDK